MPYVCDLRSAPYNNVIEVGGKLLIEGVEVTPTNLAPVPFSFGPSTVSAADGQLLLRWVYRRGSGLTAPNAGTLGQINTARISCGQNVTTDVARGPNNGYYYGLNYGQNAISQFNSNFRALSTSITVGGSNMPNLTTYQQAKVFLPFASSTPADGGWIVVSAYSAMAPDSANNNLGYSGGSACKLSEAGVVSNIGGSTMSVISMPYIGSETVVIVGTPWPGLGTTVNDQNYGTKVRAINRLTGAGTMSETNWIPAATSSSNSRGCFPSNAVIETPGSSVYFYHPILSTSALSIYVGTISSLSGTPTISSITGNQLTAVGGGALDTSQVVFPAVIYPRQIRLWVVENEGNRYLNALIYEPGSSTSVGVAATDLYVWQLNSKTTATFLQKAGLSTTFGRIRAVLPTDTTQKTIVVVYDTTIAFYRWNPATNWTFLTSQSVQAQEVGIDTYGRVWVTSQSDYSSTTAQTLSVFDATGAAANIALAFDATSYTYSGSPVSGNLIVNAYDINGNRVALGVTLTRASDNFAFSGGAVSTTTTTSTSGNVLVPVTISAAGRLLCVAAPT